MIEKKKERKGTNSEKYRLKETKTKNSEGKVSHFEA